MKMFLVFTFCLVYIIVAFVSQGLYINSTCGSPQTLFMKYENINRTSYLYIPSYICNVNDFTDYIVSHETFNNFKFDTNKHHFILPTLVALHCLGCNHIWELNKYVSYVLHKRLIHL